MAIHASARARKANVTTGASVRRTARAPETAVATESDEEKHRRLRDMITKLHDESAELLERANNLMRLGMNKEDRLFWHGRRVEVRRRLHLTAFQKIVAAVVTVCAVLGGLGGFVTGLNNASVFLCARGHHWRTCPAVKPGPAARGPGLPTLRT